MAIIARRLRRTATCLALLASSAFVCIASSHAADPDKPVDKIPTASPIKHVIIIVGENRSFDHLFATYVPKHDRVLNLLSEGIIKGDGSPGPNFAKSHQFKIGAPPNGSERVAAPGRRSRPARLRRVPDRHRRHRPAELARPRHAHHPRNQPAARPVPADRPDHAV